MGKNIARAEGQIWIDKKSPFKLKYYVNDTENIVATSATYNYKSDLPEGSIILRAGTVVKFNGRDQITKAKFPDDINDVLGVVATDLVQNKTSTPVAVIQTGYIILEDPQEIFATTEDITLGTNGYGKYSEEYSRWEPDNIIGAPVYWFIGRINKSAGSYNYLSPLTPGYEGKLTLATPSGFRGNLNIEDDSLNVGYDNLPQIGSISSCEIEGNKLTKVTIHLNFSAFDSSLEWNWPYMHDRDASNGQNITCGKITPSKNEASKLISTPVQIRHGLFAPSAKPNPGFAARCYTQIVASPEVDGQVGTEEYVINTDVNNDYTSNGGSTIVSIRHPETLYLRISGRVNYKFDKKHQ